MRTRLLKVIEQKAAEATLEYRLKGLLDDDEVVTGEAWLFGYFAEGATSREVGEALGCSRGMVYTLIQSYPDGSEKLAAARRASAPIYAEDAGDIADNLTKRFNVDGSPTFTTPGDVAAAREQIGVRKWYAEMYDRKVYGKQADTQVNVQLNVGQLHLEALRRRTIKSAPAEVLQLPPAESDESAA